MSKIDPITIDAADRDELEGLVRDRNTAQKVVWRARIVTRAALEEPARAGQDPCMLTGRRAAASTSHPHRCSTASRFRLHPLCSREKRASALRAAVVKNQARRFCDNDCDCRHDRYAVSC